LADKKNHKEYETVFIIRPNLDEDAVDRCVASVEEFIKSHQGHVVSTDKKGRRRLAYEVKKMRDGFYVQIDFTAEPTAVVQIQRMLTLSEEIIRSIIVVKEREEAKL
jgi:small subunit ribosomal protein S6